MLQYDLTSTSLFDQLSRATMPCDAEMFVITAALLLVYEATYSDLEHSELVLSEANLESVAECVEVRLPEFAPDLERLRTLRERLSDFVGLRVAGIPTPRHQARPKPT